MRQWFSLLTISLLTHLLPCFSFVNEDHDTQVWQYDVLWFKLTPKDRLRVASEFRWADGVTRCYFFYQELQYHRTIWPCFELAPGYRQIWSTIFTGGGTWKPIYVPMLDGTFTFEWHNWKWVNRNRAEYAMLHQTHNFWILRTRARFFFPCTFSKYQIRPFIDDELFFLQRLGFSQNRFSFGAKFGISEKVSGHLFFMLRHITIGKEWRQHNVIGNRLVFNF